MTTKVAPNATKGAQPLRLYSGLNTAAIIYNSEDDEIEATATTVLLAKIPRGARITDLREYHSTGASTATINIGIGSKPDEFIIGGAQSTINRATKGIIDYKVTVSASSAIQYEYLTATITPSSAVSDVKISVAIDYIADGQ